MEHPAVVVQLSGAGRAADGKALHDSKNCVIGVVVNLPHVHIRTDGAVQKSLPDSLGHGTVGGFKGLGGLVLNFVELSRTVQRQLRIQGEPHPLGIHTVESGVADKKFCRILQASRAVSGAVVLKHPVNAFQHPVPVQQGSRQNQIRLGFKIPEHRTLGKPGQPGNVCNLCFLDSVFKKTVQGLFRNQPDVFLPLFLVRQVMLPPMYLSV